MTEEEEWVKTAMSDDSIVVEMLLRLHQTEPPPTPPSRKKAPAAPFIQWSVRQRRSKHVPGKKGDATRASPTTPLSWSGATSVSGGVAVDVGFEESSKPSSKPMDNPRSKLVATGETATHKRSRKKKTLAELNEEESLLLKERKDLKNKLATLRLSCEKQRAENERLKRMKLDILSQQETVETVRASAPQEVILSQLYQKEVFCDPSCMILPANSACNDGKPSPSHGSSEVQEDGSKGSSFLLPDLNLPFDNDSGFRNLYGIS